MPRSNTRPTLADIAAELAVTPAAVSLALNGRPGVSEALRQQAQVVAARLGYRPNHAAVALRTERTSVMAIINRNLRNPAFLDVIDGFDHECFQQGYQVMSGSAHFQPDRERTLIATFADRQVDGLAIAPTGVGAVVRHWLRRTGRPVVIINANSTIKDRRVMSVRAGVETCMPDIVEHLAGLGHRRIALLAAPAAKSPDPAFAAAFDAEVRRRRLHGTVVESELELEAAREALRELLAKPAARRVTAVVTDSDYIAQAVYFAARDLDLAIPRDLSVVGQGDTPMGRLFDPPLSTLPIDARRLGGLAARLLLDAVAGRPITTRHIALPTRLLVRGSTGAAPDRP